MSETYDIASALINSHNACYDSLFISTENLGENKCVVQASLLYLSNKLLSHIKNYFAEFMLLKWYKTKLLYKFKAA